MTLPEPEMRALVGFLKTLAPPRGGRGGRGFVTRTKVQLTDGKSLEGVALGSTSREVQLRTDDQRIHLLRKSGEQYREVTSQVDWSSYHGQFSGNRHTADVANRQVERRAAGAEVGLRACPMRRACRALRRSTRASCT